ncbi:helix-turn-helix domain-containing protein [Undibacterium sp.]|uniref:helix-turn-helix domain-containing protein n=1 Tax=Undibacterium sp. TaxID=1914977 RepID=UPI002731E689|nr:helix-turn-helix transcriptional regulator [Undibacterium sp.]MDP1976271.1 helix-turn-helix transcriptional regulator [Undibacterium sp.]
MSDLGNRLRDERKRLGLNQLEFAVLGGVKKNAQMNYESGERSPDADYLSALLKADVDVMYVLTGARAAAGLQGNENDLLSGFRKLDQRFQDVVVTLVNGLGHEPVNSAPTNNIKGNVGQVIHGNQNNESPLRFSFGKKEK